MFQKIRKLLEDISKVLGLNNQEYVVKIDLVGYDKIGCYYWAIVITILNENPFSFLIHELNRLCEEHPQIGDIEYGEDEKRNKRLVIHIME